MNEAPAGIPYVFLNKSTVDHIEFAIGSGPVSIALSGPLPTVIDELTVDASTQPGYADHPLVTLDGSAIVTASTVTALESYCPMSVRGLRFTHFHSTDASLGIGVGLRVSTSNTDYEDMVVAGNEFIDNDFGLVVSTAAPIC